MVLTSVLSSKEQAVGAVYQFLSKGQQLPYSFFISHFRPRQQKDGPRKKNDYRKG